MRRILSVHEGWKDIYLLAQLDLCRVEQVGEWHHPLNTPHTPHTHNECFSWWPLCHSTCNDLTTSSVTKRKWCQPHEMQRLQGLLTNSMLLLMFKKHPKKSINCEQELIQNICLNRTVQSHGFPLHSGSSQRPQVCYVAQMLLPVIWLFVWVLVLLLSSKHQWPGALHATW